MEQQDQPLMPRWELLSATREETLARLSYPHCTLYFLPH